MGLHELETEGNNGALWLAILFLIVGVIYTITFWQFYWDYLVHAEQVTAVVVPPEKDLAGRILNRPPSGFYFIEWFDEEGNRFTGVYPISSGLEHEDEVEVLYLNDNSEIRSPSLKRHAWFGMDLSVIALALLVFWYRSVYLKHRRKLAGQNETESANQNP